MAAVKCGVDGCGNRLQPYVKVDPRDRDTWLYPECEQCGRPACDKHLSEFGGRLVCTRCQREIAAKEQPVTLIDLGIRSSIEDR